MFRQVPWPLQASSPGSWLPTASALANLQASASSSNLSSCTTHAGWKRPQAPTAGLVLLVERATGHVVKVILKADDSDGLVGDLARELLDLHARACDAGKAERAAGR
jgi:hypothetical protein